MDNRFLVLVLIALVVCLHASFEFRRQTSGEILQVSSAARVTPYMLVNKDIVIVHGTDETMLSLGARIMYPWDLGNRRVMPGKMHTCRGMTILKAHALATVAVSISDENEFVNITLHPGKTFVLLPKYARYFTDDAVECHTFTSTLGMLMSCDKL